MLISTQSGVLITSSIAVGFELVSSAETFAISSFCVVALIEKMFITASLFNLVHIALFLTFLGLANYTSLSNFALHVFINFRVLSRLLLLIPFIKVYLMSTKPRKTPPLAVVSIFWIFFLHKCVRIAAETIYQAVSPRIFILRRLIGSGTHTDVVGYRVTHNAQTLIN